MAGTPSARSVMFGPVPNIYWPLGFSAAPAVSGRLSV